MTMLQVSCLGMIGVLSSLLLKEMRSSFAAIISMGTCVLIAYFGICRLELVMEMIATMEQLISLNNTWFQILLKITGITYLADFSANLCRDAGYSAIAGQIEVFGKISILAISSPVILALVETIYSFLN